MATDLADLIIGRERDPQLRFGPCPWVGPEDAAAGDTCLVVFDDEREPWAIVPGTFTRA
jgi:hypothetical protein